jgi:hypothetical protein
MRATEWWTCTRCETQLRAGMSFCWECGEAVPGKDEPVELYRNWGGEDMQREGGTTVVGADGTRVDADWTGSGYFAVFPYVWHGDYTVVAFPNWYKDGPTNPTPVTVVDGELTEVDWR